MGVRGIALAEGDTLISLAILRHVEATSDERSAYCKMRRAVAGETPAEEPADADGERRRLAAAFPGTLCDMSAQEQVVLTVSVNGYGKRTSSYEYRTTGRGGKGIVAMSVNSRNGKLVASFPVSTATRSCW
jgi:DNA gyrase subunit A